MDIEGKKLFILCRKNGLIIADKSNQSSPVIIHKIDFPSNTNQIKVKNNTIFINY
jgi:hypothetical protein